MSEPQISPTHRQSAALWLTCPDCGHTSRVLAVMASRVLWQRRECCECLSMQMPLLKQTSVGAHIPATEAQHTLPTEEEQAQLEAWIEHQGGRSWFLHVFHALLSRLAARFSRSRTVDPQTSSAGSAGGDELHLKPSGNDL